MATMETCSDVAKKNIDEEEDSRLRLHVVKDIERSCEYLSKVRLGDGVGLLVS